MKKAIQGGKPLRVKPFPRYNSIGDEEKRAVAAVLDSGVLSDFYGSYGERFEGGPQVRALEEEWKSAFSVGHAVSMNSATSALYAAVGALGIGPGDEVIVSPYTMSASATCVILYGATPVFADVEEDYFCLDPEDVRRKLTAKTKAIVAVDLAGQAADWTALRSLAKSRNLRLIEDCAQAPGARFGKRWAGTCADIGIYSLNCHKTIQTGEGGIAVTADTDLAFKLKLLRNHAEAVVGGMPNPSPDLRRLWGFNFRMTEIEAAIGRVQLKKLEGLNRQRQERVDYLNSRLKNLPGIIIPPVRPGSTHVYYTHMLRVDPKTCPLDRSALVKAVNAEGIPVSAGYVKPLYRLPVFAGRKPKPDCPVVERLHFNEVIVNTLIYPPLTHQDLDDVAEAFIKVLGNA